MFQLGPDAVPVGGPACRLLVGSQLPAGAGGGRLAGAGCGPAGRACVCRQHRRGAIVGSLAFSLLLIPWAGHAAVAAGDHRPLRVGGDCARPVAPDHPRSRTGAGLRNGVRVCARRRRLSGPLGGVRLRPPHPQHARLRAPALCGRGHELLGRRFHHGRRDAAVSRQRQGGGLRRLAGHAYAAHARTPAGAGARRTAVGAGGRLRRGRDSGVAGGASQRPRESLSRKSSRWCRRSWRGTSPARTTTCLATAAPRSSTTTRGTTFSPRAKFDVHHLRSDPPLGQGGRHALLAGVLRAVQAPLEAGRGGGPVGAALREHARYGEERDRDLLGGLSRGNRLE